MDDVADLPRTLGIDARSAAAAILGAAGPVLRLAVIEGQGRLRAAIVALATAVVVEVLLRRRPAPWSWLAASAAVAGAGVLVVGDVGRAPLVLVGLGVAAAHAALVEWRPLPGWPPRPVTVVGTGVGLVVGASAVWVRSGSNVATASLLAAAIAAVELAHRRPRWSAAAEHAVRTTVVRVAAAIGALALFLTVSVTLYAVGAVGRAGRAASRRLRPAPSTFWFERDDERSVGRDAARPYSTAPAPLRLARSVSGTGVLAAIVVAALVVADSRSAVPPSVTRSDESASSPTTERSRSSDDPFDQIDRTPYSERPGYADMPFADDLQDELLSVELQPDAITGYVNGDATGRFVNIDGGDRRTLRPDCRCPEVSMWMLGASTTFGVAQRDEHTVASELVRLARQDGIALDVRNLGVPGWTIWQEARHFERRLTTEQPPELAIFLDGFNDTLGTVTQSVVAGRILDRTTVLNNDDVVAATRRRLSADAVGGGAALGREAARRYRVERERVMSTAASLGIDVEMFFQPDALASPAQRRAVEGTYSFDPDLFERAEIDAALDAASTALEGDVHNLRHVLDDAPRAMFGDVVHTGEAGARLVASAIYDVIRADVLAAARSMPGS